MSKLTHEQALNYWKNPDEQNNPSGYLKPIERSEYLYKQVFQRLKINKDSKVVELGCNVCRNLHHLVEQGHDSLYGVEINELAVHTWLRTYPDDITSIWVYNRSIENFLKLKNDWLFEVVYTMAVLLHIHPDVIESVIKGMVRISRRYIAIIEWESDNEEIGGERCWGRQYQPMFEKHGCKQIYSEPVGTQADEHLSAYTLRIFEVKQNGS